MQQPKRPSDKTYSDVMNEWAAQRNLLNADRNRLLHPPFDAHPVARFFGYVVRIALVTIVPAGIFFALLLSHLGSREFNEMLSAGTARTLGAEKAVTQGSRWKFSGMLSMQSLKATGGSDAFYSQLEARNISTRVAFPALFRRAWILPRISLGELSIAFRSGGLGKVPFYPLDDDGISLPATGGARAAEPPKTGAVIRPPGGLLRAGYGVDPDFSSLRINEMQTARLNATWGSLPATSGALTGLQTNFTRSTTGWVISGNGGEFRQGWLDGLRVDQLSVKLGAAEAVIDGAALTRPGGAKGTFTGRLTYGEVPEVEGVMQLEDLAFEELVPPAAAGLFKAVGKGRLKFSGSVNRTTGIRMEGELEVQSGRMAALPVLKALNQLTGEDQFRLLSIRSGRVRFVSSGGEGHGGQLVEVKEIEADCGPLLRLNGNLRHENIFEIGDLSGKEAANRLAVTGVIRMGLSAIVTARLKPAVVERFLKKEDSGWAWLEIPVEGPLTPVFTRELAAEILKVSAAAP